MKTKTIIQARVGSTRLPRKVLLTIMNKPVLEYVIERVSRAKNIDGVIIATTTSEEDSPILGIATKLKMEVYRGSENDILDRFYHAAKAFGAENIVRITADCPLIDPEIIDSVVDCYIKNKADYCSNVLEPTFPDGEDVEVFSFRTLERAWKDASLASEREHVTPYIWKNAGIFNLRNFRNATDLSGKRWTLDEPKDFEFIKTILEALYPAKPDFHMEDVLDFLEHNPHVEEINRGITRDEGYLKSVKEDKIIYGTQG